MGELGSQNLADCQLGDKRLELTALEIGKALVVVDKVYVLSMISH